MAAATRSANMSWNPRNRGSSEWLSERTREDSCGTGRGPVVPPCVLSVGTDCPEAMTPKKATRHVVRSRIWEFCVCNKFQNLTGVSQNWKSALNPSSS